MAINAVNSNNTRVSTQDWLKQQVYETIQSKSLRSGDRLPPISLLAKKWNVNYRTIRSVLNSLEKEGVVKYRPNKGVEVKNGVTQSIAISFTRWKGDAYCLRISDGIAKFAKEKGIEFLLVDANCSHQRFVESISHPSGKIQGLIVEPFELPEYADAVNKAIEKGVKVIFVDRFLEDIPASSVSVDHFAGAYQATSHLIKSHRRPVYYLGTTKEPSSCRQRVDGWANAMRDYNFFDIDNYIHEVPVSESEIALASDDGMSFDVSAAKSLLSEVETPLSIFCCNDYIARGVYDAASSMNLKIGKDVFVVGFGDMPLCKNFDVELSSVDQSSEIVGYEAARMLYEQLTGQASRPISRLIPAKLCVRNSSLPCG